MSFNFTNGFCDHLPYFAEGPVIHGFGRGGKQLGIPTANLPDEVVGMLPPEMECGVYYGWASVDHGEVHKMVMSIGYNPVFNNTRKTMETHIMSPFQDDFYGSHLKILITGYIRPQLNFTSLDDSSLGDNLAIGSFHEHRMEQLIEAIREDIQHAWNCLDSTEHGHLIENHFLCDGNANQNGLDNKGSNASLGSMDNLELIPDVDSNANCDMTSR